MRIMSESESASTSIARFESSNLSTACTVVFPAQLNSHNPEAFFWEERERRVVEQTARMAHLWGYARGV